jgi:hypothetical protein
MRKILILLAALVCGPALAAGVNFDNNDQCNPSVTRTNGNLTLAAGPMVTIVALDITNGKAWWWKSNFTSTSWGGSSGINGNPYTNTNGIAWTPLSGPLYAQAYLGTASNTATLLASSALLSRFAVSGFSAWDTATSATNVLTTNSGTLTLSGGNLTATGNTSGRARSDNGVSSGQVVFGFRHDLQTTASNQTVGFAQSGSSSGTTEVAQHNDASGTVVVKNVNTTNYGDWLITAFHRGCGHNASITGKRFYEVKFDGNGAGAQAPRVGWGGSGLMQVANPVGQTIEGVGYNVISGQLIRNNGALSRAPGALNVGSTAIIAIDMTVSPRNIWFGNPDNGGGNFWNNHATDGPVTGGNAETINVTDVRAMVSTYAPGDQFTFNFGQSAAVNTAKVAELLANGWQWMDPPPSGGSRGYIFGANENFPGWFIEADRCKRAA